jgi:hypothetical protein
MINQKGVLQIMANKLKDMKLTSVDLCKRGANPKSHIRLFKSRDGEKGGEEGMKLAKSYCIGDAEHMTTTLFKSLESIIADESLDSVEKQELMAESLQDFTLDVTDNIERWSESIGKADEPEEPDEPDDDYDDDDPEDEEGIQEKKTELGKGSCKKSSCRKSLDEKEGVYKMDETVIDIEKMSLEDQQILKSLQEKYAGTQAVEKSEPEIHPEVKKALNELDELKKSIEMERMTEVAKKYEIIGKKADELAPKLYELKKSGDAQYNDYVAVLDEMVQMQETSGVFKEYGSSRSGSGADLDGIVADLRKSMPEASREELIIKAYEMNPNLDSFSGKLK